MLRAYSEHFLPCLFLTCGLCLFLRPTLGCSAPRWTPTSGFPCTTKRWSTLTGGRSAWKLLPTSTQSLTTPIRTCWPVRRPTIGWHGWIRHLVLVLSFYFYDWNGVQIVVLYSDFVLDFSIFRFRNVDSVIRMRYWHSILSILYSNSAFGFRIVDSVFGFRFIKCIS